MLIGLVGAPNKGKSTFFKASTLADVDIANYPFTTINPNKGIAFVKVECVDKDFKVQCNPRFGFCQDSKRFVPVELIDVAGLVPGAHEGKGRGNEFLDDLNQADVLINVIDISGTTNEKGEIVNNHDITKDVKFLELELDMWYFRIIKKGWDKFSRKMQQENEEIKKALSKQLSGLKVTEEMIEISIEKLNLPNFLSWSDQDLLKLASELRKLSKPMVIAANKIDLSNENLEKLQKEIKDYKIIPCSAESELALKEAAKHDLIEYIPGDSNFKIKGNLNENQKSALNLIKDKVLSKYSSTGIQDVLNYAVFDLLKYIVVFPGGVNKLEDSSGKVLPDCFLMPKNSAALDFAYKIHQDLGDKFIKAIDVKTKKAVGKDYALKNRDVIEIITKK